MNEEFFKQRAMTVRALADKADPFTKKRLLDLALRYEQGPRPVTPIPSVAVEALKSSSSLSRWREFDEAIVGRTERKP